MYIPRTVCPWSSALTSLRSAGGSVPQTTVAGAWSPNFVGPVGTVGGLSGCATDCRCGGTCGGGGMGRVGRGMGLFDTPFDLSTWGWGEWGIALIAGYALVSMVFTSRSAQRSISRSRRKSSARRTAKRRQELEAELARL